MLIVDLAVPRDVESRTGKIKNVFLYTIDDLNEVVRRTFKLRRAQRKTAENIIDSHVDEFARNLNLHRITPTIEALYARMKKIADEELADAGKKLTPAEREILRRALHRTGRKFLHPAAEYFQKTAATSDAKTYAATVSKIFDLD